MHVLAVFGALDWGVVGAYFAVVTIVGLYVGGAKRGRGEGRAEKDSTDYFLGGRSLPTWAVALSLVATMLSTATFVGVPDLAFSGNLTYLILNVGGIIAVFVVALLFVPRLYAAGTVTIYGFLAQRFGEPARLAVSCAFIVGRLLASGARLFLAAIPLCLLMFGAKSPTFSQYVLSICLIGIVGTFYATVGGVRAVVWVDTIQFVIVVGTAVMTIMLLLRAIPLSIPEMLHALRDAPVNGGGTKLTVLDLSFNPAKSNTLWAAIFGNTFLMVAAYGTDQDLAQRFLISKSAKKGALSVIASQFIGIAVVMLFLCIGLLLYIFYDRPDIMGAAHELVAERKSVYPWFLLHELPTGLAGISIAGLFAVAQGSLDSAMNAIASSIVADVVGPLRRKRADVVAVAHAEASKLTVAAVGATLCLFAIACAATYDRKATLVDFALGVLTFAFSGMLGVFLTALLTRRGNSTSVIAALVVGAVAVGFMQDRVMTQWTPLVFGHAVTLAWPWWMPIASTLAFLVCISGRRKACGTAFVTVSPASTLPASDPRSSTFHPPAIADS